MLMVRPGDYSNETSRRDGDPVGTCKDRGDSETSDPIVVEAMLRGGHVVYGGSSLLAAHKPSRRIRCQGEYLRAVLHRGRCDACGEISSCDQQGDQRQWRYTRTST